MIETYSERDPLDELAESFLARFRAGECPSVTEYTEKHPEMADEIRELFPALVVMEKARPQEAARTQAADEPVIPSSLGDYHLIREVGRGGMGVVFEAVQESLHRHVALKVLPYHSWVKPTHLARFRREAQAAARLHHTNIVPVFGVGEHEGIHYYAMQFIHGQGLDAVLQEVKRLRGQTATTHPGDGEPDLSLAFSVAESLLTGRFSNEESSPQPPPRSAEMRSKTPPSLAGKRARGLGDSDPPTPPPGSHSDLSGQTELKYFRGVAHIGVQIADALAYAHSQGVLHRDIKPSNLLLDTAGRVWITDFGLAKTEDSEELTHTGDVVGTLRFMAPERFQGTADARSDVYGLGITLYEMLTLRPAFADSNRQQLIQQITEQDPLLPHKLDRNIPRDLETVMLKAIAKEPSLRYFAAEEMAADLRCFLGDRPIQARRSPAWEKAWRWYRRNRLVAILSLLAILLFLGLGIAVPVGILFRSERNKAQEAETKAQDLLARAQRAEGEVKIRHLLAEASANRRGRRMGQRFQSLEILAETAKMVRHLELPVENFLELRNEIIACLALPDLRVDKELPGFPAGSQAFDFDGKLECYAVADGEGRVSVRRVIDNAEIAPVPPAGPGTKVRFSHDGLLLAVINSQQFKVWKLTDQRPVEVPLEIAPPGNEAYDFSPDDRKLAVGHPDGSIDLYDLSICRALPPLKGGPRPWHLAFHPTKPQLAVAYQGGVQVRDLATGRVLAQFHIGQPNDPAWPWVAWHSKGKVLAAVGEDSNIYLWDIPTKKQIGKLEGCGSGGIKLTFNHAGDLLASMGWEGLVRFWDWRTGKQLFSTQAGTQALHFSPDDRLLAAEVLGNQLRTWEVAAGRAYRTLVRDPVLGKTQCFTATIHHDGRLLAVGTIDGFGLWDLKTNEELDFIRLPGLNHVLFEPSGSLLTNGQIGLLRWPVKFDAASPGLVQVGPPQKLPLPGTVNQIASSRVGRILASAQEWGAYVLHPDRSPLSLIHEGVRYVAVSPDGRWVATGSHGASPLVKVWDAATGKPDKELRVGSSGHVAFSPNGKWLATVGDGVGLWATDSWEQPVRFESRSHVGLAFSPDSRMLAFETGYGTIRLIDPEASGEREWARLEDPDQHRAGFITFSPDGSQLVKTGTDRLAVWDLRAIRQELAVRRLDWNLPAHEPPKQKEEMLPLKVEMDMGILSPQGEARSQIARSSLAIAAQPINPEAYYQRGLPCIRLQQWESAIDDLSRDILLRPSHGEAYSWRGNVHRFLNDYPLALADFTTAVKLLPPDPSLFLARGDMHLRLHDFDKATADFDRALQLALEPERTRASISNGVAWLYATGPVGGRAPDKALPLAEKAVRLEPKNWNYLNTLGVVYYRLERWDAAIDTLQRAIQSVQGEETSPDLFFLAMSYHHLGDNRKARECFDKAVQWQQEHPGTNPYEKEVSTPYQKKEMQSFRAEAEALLGKTSPP